MKIEKIEIDNFKSLNNFKIHNPNPFSVFVGANGVGKSNIFEALEFLNYSVSIQNLKVEDLFGGYTDFVNYKRLKDDLIFTIKFQGCNTSGFRRSGYEKFGIDFFLDSEKKRKPVEIVGILNGVEENFNETEALRYNQFVKNFSRIFINESKKIKLNTTSDNKLNLDCSNLEKVLKRLLSNNNSKEDIKEWLSLFIPAFKDISINSYDLKGTETLEFYEKNSDKPFTKNLISDGTYNILCLLTSIYQSNTPQFICIEEPENGLNPYVVKELVTFFREQCKDKGHYIWLNTHSQTLVNQLKPEEIIVVNKEEGNTVAKQFIGKDMQGMAMDTAWLTNFFGGGVPW